jgi:cytochrome c-type biogenesis protein CcmH
LKPTFRKLALILILALTPLMQAADRDERVRELSSKFICVCGGCNQLLMNCNHIGCPSREGMFKALRREIDDGKDDATIVADFSEKFGISVLSAPPASGFNLTAWVMPFAMLAAGAFVAIHFVRRFRMQSANAAETNTADLTKYQDKVEEELKKFTPED